MINIQRESNSKRDIVLLKKYTRMSKKENEIGIGNRKRKREGERERESE